MSETTSLHFYVLSAAEDPKQHVLPVSASEEIMIQKLRQNMTLARGEMESGKLCPLTAVSVCFGCQLGGEENCVWTDPVLEPHHTHYTVGEADQVSALCSPQKLQPRPLSSNSRASMEDLISDLSTLKLESSGEH